MIKIEDVIHHKNIKIIDYPVTDGFIDGKYEPTIPTNTIKVIHSTIEKLLFDSVNSNKLINIYPDFKNGLIYHSGGLITNPSTFEPVNIYYLRYCLSDLVCTEAPQIDINEHKIKFRYLLIK